MIRETGAPRLLIVEGTLQHLAAASWAPDGCDVWGLNGGDGIHRKTNLERVAGRDIWLAYDADRTTKPEVAAAAARVTSHLRKHGAATVRWCTVPAVAGEHTGFDDWLASLPEGERTTSITQLLDDAVEAESTPADDHEMWPPHTVPMAVARRWAENWQHPSGTHTLRYRNGEWLHWCGTHYIVVEDKWISKLLYETLENVFTGKPGSAVPWAPTRSRIADVKDALQAVLMIPATEREPGWLNGTPDSLIIPCANGLLDAGTRQLYAHTPQYFCRSSVPFSYDPAAPEPVNWLAFLGELWPGDDASTGCLQEMAGYILSRRTDLHKAFLIVGPARGGKGTIARVLSALLGEGVCGPLLSSLGTRFGLENLLGKSLAIIADIRLSPKTDLSTLAERLLAITGEDALDAERKYEGKNVHGRLNVRFMMMANELPRFQDVSGALATRFVVLKLTQSWLGREDLGLYGKLAPELPGILNWALDGLDRLTRQGHFTEPESASDLVEALAESASPLKMFIRDKCETGTEYEIDCTALYAAWKGWCITSGREHIETIQQFGVSLRAADPGITMTRPREGGERIRKYQGISLRSALVRGPTHSSRTEGTYIKKEENIYNTFVYREENAVGRGPTRTTSSPSLNGHSPSRPCPAMLPCEICGRSDAHSAAGWAARLALTDAQRAELDALFTGGAP